MILVGNQRGGAGNLAAHLMNSHDNEHVEVHELRGFMATDDLREALQEVDGISRGTRCRQYLYSLSLNPPKEEAVETSVFERTIERIEQKLGLSGQPRAIVFHEKEGVDGETRRHAHAVWSRINAEEMKAVPISYPKKKLRDISREIYIEQGWKMPRGFVNSEEANPLNFTHAEWQQARRVDKDPRQIKGAIQDAWAISDSAAAFTQAMDERGYRIARGDRRAFVAVDANGEVYSIPKMAGVKTKDVRTRLGDENAYGSVDETKDQIAAAILGKLDGFKDELKAQRGADLEALTVKKAALVQLQRDERNSFLEAQNARQTEEAAERQARFRSGVAGLWDRLRGEHKRIEQRNAQDAQSSLLRDRTEKDAFIFKQIEQRRELSAQAFSQRREYVEERQALNADRERYQAMRLTQEPSDIQKPLPQAPPVQAEFRKTAPPAEQQEQAAYRESRLKPSFDDAAPRLEPRAPKPGL